MMVRWVNDGDTIVLKGGMRVRYLGIDTPEIDHEKGTAEPFGYQARRANLNMVYKKRVRLEFDTERYDRYGRNLAYVFMRDGTFVNRSMIESGYAYFIIRGKNTKYKDVLLAAQRKAMTAGKGIWRQLHGKKGRDGSRKDTPDGVVGNRRSMRFHSVTCRYGRRISGKNRIIYSGMREAFWAGFAPCKICMKLWFAGG
jgi:endonuclease YncB( thermonuclease family)